MCALCILFLFFYNCCLAAKLYPTLHNSIDCSMLGSSVLQRNLLKFMSIESVMLSNHLILCRPLLILPSVFPSIRDFSSESALHIRWPKYWSFSFSITPSNEYSGLLNIPCCYQGEKHWEILLSVHTWGNQDCGCPMGQPLTNRKRSQQENSFSCLSLDKWS